MQDRYQKVITATFAYHAVCAEVNRIKPLAARRIPSAYTSQLEALYETRADLLAIITETEL